MFLLKHYALQNNTRRNISSMPTLNKKVRNRNKLPRPNKLCLPHSPFQKLIDGHRVRYGMSYRELADAIGVSHASLYVWLNNENGYPSVKSMKASHLKGLSTTLKIPLPQIQVALDDSRRIYASATVSHAPSIDGLADLIGWLEHDTRVMIRRSTLLSVARRLHAGSQKPS